MVQPGVDRGERGGRPRPSPCSPERGLVFEEDGATWLRTADFGDPREKRVLKRSDGDYTYLAGDIAYHRNKFLVRGFDRVINVWGADHQGQVASLKAGVAALGVDPDRLEIRLGQMISLASGTMSKRAGNAVDLDDLVDDIGADAMRLLSLVNSIDQATTRRPRQGQGRVQGEPGLLRADGLRPHRRHRPGGGQAAR